MLTIRLPVHSKAAYGDTSGRRQAKNLFKIFAECEVIVPVVKSRLIERGGESGEEVNSVDMIALASVASGASGGEIRRTVQARAAS